MKKILDIRLSLFLFVLLCQIVSPPHANSSEMMIVSEEYPPLSFSKDGKVTGASAELVKEILRRLDQPETINVLPWARGYNLLLTKPNVVLFTTTRTAEREKLFHWIGPLYVARNGFYRKKGSEIHVDTLEDAKNAGIIATYKNDAREQMLIEWGFTNIDSSKSAKSNLKKLISGRVDLWFFDNIGVKHVAKMAKVDPAEIELALTVDEVSLYIAISKQTPLEIVNKWKVALYSMKADGTYLSISEKWLPKNCIPNYKALKRKPSTQSHPLKIYTEDSPPANYALNGKPTGLAVEIVYEILNRLGENVEIEIVPWSRGYKSALTRPNVGLFSTTRIPQREKLFKWVGPLYIQQWGFYAKKGSGLRINSLDEAKKVGSIGTYLNDAKEQFLKKEGFQNLVTTNKNASNIKHLLKGQIDLWVSSDFNMPYLARQAGVSPDKLELVYAFRTVKNYIAFSISTDDEVISVWQQAFDSIIADGTFNNIDRSQF